MTNQDKLLRDLDEQDYYNELDDIILAEKKVSSGSKRLLRNMSNPSISPSKKDLMSEKEESKNSS